MEKRILVTGAAGFVGNIVCRELIKNNYKVVALDNLHKGNADSLLDLIGYDNFEFHYADVTTRESLFKVFNGPLTGIIHLAAIVGFPACKRQPTLSKNVNVDGTQILLELRDEYYDDNIPFIYASTGSIYGKIEEICTEDTNTNPQSLYGIHKLEAETLVRSRPNTISLRFATAFGVSPSHRVNLLVNDLVCQAVTKGSIAIFQADFKRTFIHVKDMSRAFEFCIKNYKNMRHNVYNCGDKKLNWSKRELAEYIKFKTACAVFYGEHGWDADQRDYEVSYKRLNDEGFYTTINMSQGIDELIKAVPLLRLENYQ